MNKQTEVLKLALEALEKYCTPYRDGTHPADEAITAIREALAEQPAQQSHVHAISGKTADELWLETGRLRSELADLKAQQQEPLTGGDERRHIICLCPDCTKPAQEPVAFEIRAFNATQALIKRADVAQEKADALERGFGSEADVTIVPLYTPPPASKPWVGLTNKEWQEIVEDNSLDTIGAIKIAIEAKLKEKNA